MKINLQTFPNLIPPEEPTKAGRVLHHLACGHSLNRFEAERRLHDHTLNSTVSELANRHRILISRERETVPNFEGKPVHCNRYRLDTRPENLARCYWLLRSWGWRPTQLEMDLPTPPEAA